MPISRQVSEQELLDGSSIDILKYSMDNSAFTTIGYSHRFETKAYEFLREYNPIYINALDLISGDDLLDIIKISVRNDAIDCVLDSINDIPIYPYVEKRYVINLSNIIPSKHNGIVEYIRNFLMDLITATLDCRIKIVLLVPTTKTFNGLSEGVVLRQGSTPLYVSDLVLAYSEDGDLKIIKNRYG